jgi:hypothetical protein
MKKSADRGMRASFHGYRGAGLGFGVVSDDYCESDETP